MNTLLVGVTALAAIFIVGRCVLKLLAGRLVSHHQRAADLVNAARTISISALTGLRDLAPTLALTITTDAQRDLFERRTLAAGVGVGIMQVLRESPGTAGDELVRLIRDELTRRYPDLSPLVDDFLGSEVTANVDPKPREIGVWVLAGIPSTAVNPGPGRPSLGTDDACFRLGLLIKSARSVLQ